ncbi:flagellar export chaperone FlgN [Paractinoplanes durhamensis]|uniref:flagellar export chaperone FlgN n=1 Tax=Paractinoplanes durhamensis TaxID=113563 RepID=UPI0036392CB7
MSLTDLASVLWRSRELLEMLLFKLEEEQLLLASNRSRWLSHATREVEVVLDQIRQTEVIRAAYAQDVAVELGLGAEASSVSWPTPPRRPGRTCCTSTARLF